MKQYGMRESTPGCSLLAGRGCGSGLGFQFADYGSCACTGCVAGRGGVSEVELREGLSESEGEESEGEEEGRGVLHCGSVGVGSDVECLSVVNRIGG